MNKIEKTNKKGHFEVMYTDELVGTGFYDCTLDDVVISLARSKETINREVKSIEWIEEE